MFCSLYSDLLGLVALSTTQDEWLVGLVHLLFLIIRPTGPSSSLYSQDEWLVGLVHIFLDIQAYWA